MYLNETMCIYSNISVDEHVRIEFILDKISKSYGPLLLAFLNISACLLNSFVNPRMDLNETRNRCLFDHKVYMCMLGNNSYFAKIASVMALDFK